MAVGADRAGAQSPPVRAPQTIEIGAPTGVPFGAPPMRLASTSSAGVPLRYATFGTCSVAGSALVVGSTGVCWVIARAPGNTTHLPATAWARVRIVQAAPRIWFAPIRDRTLGDAPVPLEVASMVHVVPSFSSTGPCTVVGSSVRLDGVGTCTVTVRTAGDANLLPTSTSQTFAIRPRA
ncbi:MAG TPA: hypothetical protein VHK88_00820 [Aquihabitans sp.]|jgi:hypothetical protein|nr:hypothetical protein [Aquihabitans sp.]